MKTIFMLLIFLTFTLMSQNAHSQIYYQDVNPDIVLDSWNSQEINIDSSASVRLSMGGAGNLTIWEEFNSRIVINAFSSCEVLMSGTYPAALDKEQTISSNAAWEQPDYAVLNESSKGNWIGVNDKYLGVRVNKGIDWLYGWIRLDVNSAGTSVTIKDYACNRTVNTSIKAGQTASTGIDESEQDNLNLMIYPNPVFDYLYFNTKMKNEIVEVYSSFGNKVIETNLKDRIDVRTLSQGIYFVKAGNNIYKFLKM